MATNNAHQAKTTKELLELLKKKPKIGSVNFIGDKSSC